LDIASEKVAKKESRVYNFAFVNSPRVFKRTDIPPVLYRNSIRNLQIFQNEPDLALDDSCICLDYSEFIMHYVIQANS